MMFIGMIQAARDRINTKIAAMIIAIPGVLITVITVMFTRAELATTKDAPMLLVLAMPELTGN
jgi:ABC-type antimicrobial peptide transport system permease subunit